MISPVQAQKDLHPAAGMYATECKEGKLSRREFLTRTTALGLSTAAAYGLLGLAQPANAQDAKQGGTLRVQMQVKALKEPRVTDWSEIANIYRGMFDYLVEYNNDGTFRGLLLDSWEANEDATQYTLNVRKGVTWNDGSPLTAEHIAWNIEGWCDKSVEGNSMPGRMAALVNDETGKVIDGAVEVVDDHTIRLNLSKPDIAIIAGAADYPAAIVHPSFSADDYNANLGTGAFRIEEMEVGVKATLVRAENHTWWGTEVYGGPFLDRIEYIDYGTEPSAYVAAMEAEEVDMVYESVGEYIDIFDGLGLEKSEVVTAATVVLRTNQLAEVDGKKPYADVRVRRAIQMAIDNNILLELGYNGRGITAENHHVAPLHPEYAELPPQKYDPEAALALMKEAGMEDFEHEIFSIDDDWRKNTTDALAAQLRDAGFKVKRTVLPGSTFWNDWTKYPFSSTNWNHRALGVQILSVAYRSGEAWNEAGWNSPEFDALLSEALAVADAEKRSEVMAKIEKLMQDEAVIIQPYWRSLYRHQVAGLVGTGMHITLDHQHYKWGFAA
ncbi:MAG: ABC transporter substrate-binding protein [Sulfitobacter sp.]